MFSGVVRQIARTRYSAVINGQGYRAADRPVAGRSVEGGLRVLLVGTGLTSGWGVATHQLALTGLLRDELQRRSGREVLVELVGDELMNVQTASAWVGDRAAAGWDAAVLVIGSNDAARLTPLAVWEREYRELVRRIRSDLGHDAPLILAGLPPMTSITPLNSLVSGFMAAHAQKMIAVTQRVAHETPATISVALPAKATEPDRPWGSAPAYQPWADAIATVLLPALPAARRTVRGTRHPAPPSPLVEAVMTDVYRGGAPRLQPLVDEAATTFQVPSARIKLADGDRVFVAADSARGATTAMPRSLTFCDLTMQLGELEVHSVAADPRFRDNPLLDIAGATSYAGVAVRNADGDAIGTVCLFNGATATGVDMHALRDLARRVEAELFHTDSHRAEKPQHLPSTAAAAPSPSIDSGPRGPLQAVLNYAHLRLQGPRFSREARQGRTAPPTSDPVRITGLDPLRILVFGGEYAAGFGTATRAEALDGAVARLLHQHTGRGVIVHNRSSDDWRLTDLADHLGSIGAHSYDLVICAPVFSEAARHTTTRPWRTGIATLLHRVRVTSNAGTILLTIPALHGAQPIAVIGRWRARQIEQALRHSAEHNAKTLVVESPPVAMHELGTVSGAAVYEAVAQAALPAMLELLGIHLLNPSPSPSPRITLRDPSSSHTALAPN